jgi:aerobic-type carbon monoxide dehydrogenase small subunit (CoxS/CutS family)
MASDTTIYSCSTLTHRVRDQEIITVEGIAGEEPLVQHPFDGVGHPWHAI